MLQRMSRSMNTSDSHQSSLRNTTRFIQTSLGLTVEYHEVFQLEAPGVPVLLEGPLEYPRLGARPPSEGFFSLSQSVALANVDGGGLRSSRVVAFGLPSIGSSSALGSRKYWRPRGVGSNLFVKVNGRWDTGQGNH